MCKGQGACRPTQTGSFPAPWGKTSAGWHHRNPEKEGHIPQAWDPGTQAPQGLSRNVVSSRPRINIMFLFQPYQGKPPNLTAAGHWSSSPRHNPPYALHAGHTAQLMYRSTNGLCTHVPHSERDLGCYLGTSSTPGAVEQAQAAQQQTVRGTAQRNQVLSGSGGSGHWGQVGRAGGSSCCCRRDPIPHSTAPRGYDDPLMVKTFSFLSFFFLIDTCHEMMSYRSVSPRCCPWSFGQPRLVASDSAPIPLTVQPDCVHHRGPQFTETHEMPCSCRGGQANSRHRLRLSPPGVVSAFNRRDVPVLRRPGRGIISSRVQVTVSC